jgi:hypothetical protein
MSTPNQCAIDYLRSLANQEFWGAITLKYEAGEIVHLRKEENLKPSSLSELPRLSNAKSAH